VVDDLRALLVLYLATTGAGDPTKASIPLHIAANGSVEVGQDCAVVLAGDATELISQETADTSRALASLLCATSSGSCSTIEFRSTSERAAQSPVGRPTKTSRG
jgi:predicted peroxiredoxin